MCYVLPHTLSAGKSDDTFTLLNMYECHLQGPKGDRDGTSTLAKIYGNATSTLFRKMEIAPIASLKDKGDGTSTFLRNGVKEDGGCTSAFIKKMGMPPLLS